MVVVVVVGVGCGCVCFFPCPFLLFPLPLLLRLFVVVLFICLFFCCCFLFVCVLANENKKDGGVWVGDGWCGVGEVARLPDDRRPVKRRGDAQARRQRRETCHEQE